MKGDGPYTLEHARFCAESCAATYKVPWVYYKDGDHWRDIVLERFTDRDKLHVIVSPTKSLVDEHRKLTALLRRMLRAGAPITLEQLKKEKEHERRQ